MQCTTTSVKENFLGKHHDPQTAQLLRRKNQFSVYLCRLSICSGSKRHNMKLLFLLSALIVPSSLAFAPVLQHGGSVSSAKPSSSVLYEYGASSTSFYTDVEKQDSYESLESVLEAKCKDEKIRQVIVDMLDVCALITEALRTALVTVEGSTNEFGDAQLSVDVCLFHMACCWFMHA